VVVAYLLSFCLSAPEQGLLDAIPAKELKESISVLLEKIFIALMKEGPVVLVIEDMHWADSTSLELLEHLFGLVEAHPLALVGVSRAAEEEESPLLAAAQERYGGSFVPMELSPLTEEGSTELVGGLLAMKELPASLWELVVDRAEGNPFFVEEMIRTLIEQGALTRSEAGMWKATELIDTVTVPDTLHGLLMARLDALPLATKRLAHQAAVIGRILLYRVLREMAGSETKIDDDLGRMEHDDLIRKRITDPELEYMFRHALTQEVAYGSLLIAQRKDLHRLVGEAMEGIFAGRIGEFTGIIGEHFLKGEAWDKAADYLIRAGEASDRLYAHSEARAHYAHALEALARAPDTGENQQRQVDTALKFARAAEFGLPPQEILAHLEKAEQVAESMPGPDGAPGGDSARLAHVRYRMGRAYYTGGKMREAIGYYKQVLSVAAELKDPELLGIPSFAIGSALVFQGHMEKGRKLLSQGIPALEKLGSRAEWARALAMRSFAMTHMGDCLTSRIEAEKALKHSREINSLVAVWSAALMLCGAYGYGFWDVRRTLETVDAGMNAAEQTGDQIQIYMAHGVRAWNLAMFGRIEEADESMKKCQEVARKIGEQIMCADQFAARSAEIACGQGRYEEAVTLAERAVGIAQKMGGIWAEGHARRAWGKALAALTPPQWDEAEEQLAQSVQLMDSGQNLMGVAHTEIAWGELCRDRGDLDAARNHWERATAFFESKGLTKRLEQVRALMAD
jgi:tetratricopeptide (TPR) repeat protein